MGFLPDLRHGLQLRAPIPAVPDSRSALRLRRGSPPWAAAALLLLPATTPGPDSSPSLRPPRHNPLDLVRPSNSTPCCCPSAWPPPPALPLLPYAPSSHSRGSLPPRAAHEIAAPWRARVLPSGPPGWRHGAAFPVRAQ